MMTSEQPNKPELSELRLVLPAEMINRLIERVERLDTTPEEWVTTVVLEALEQPDTARDRSQETRPIPRVV